MLPSKRSSLRFARAGGIPSRNTQPSINRQLEIRRRQERIVLIGNRNFRKFIANKQRSRPVAQRNITMVLKALSVRAFLVLLRDFSGLQEAAEATQGRTCESQRLPLRRIAYRQQNFILVCFEYQQWFRLGQRWLRKGQQIRIETSISRVTRCKT